MKSFANTRLAFSSRLKINNNKEPKIVRGPTVYRDSLPYGTLISQHSFLGKGHCRGLELFLIFDYVSFISDFIPHTSGLQRTAGKG